MVWSVIHMKNSERVIPSYADSLLKNADHKLVIFKK